MKIDNVIIPEVIKTDEVKKGDMPGDKIVIGEDHIKKARTIFPLLVEEINKLNRDKIVISVFGGSGVGKSEIASLLGFFLEKQGIGSYVLSGDNYPRRIPLYNDAERMSVYRSGGLKGMVKTGVYNSETRKILDELWQKETDSDPSVVTDYPWMSEYQKAGRMALKKYLGTDKEQDYEELNNIIASFRKGEEKIMLKRMGKTEEERWYDEIDFSNINVLIIEWTHGGNKRLEGIDIPVFLNSTVAETMEHRKIRARDGKVDSAFTTMVLSIEQEELFERHGDAKIIISKAGDIISAEEVTQ